MTAAEALELLGGMVYLGDVAENGGIRNRVEIQNVDVAEERCPPWGGSDVGRTPFNIRRKTLQG